MARAKRGLHNGGSVPLGYEINKEKNGTLRVVPEYAELIRTVFRTFLKEETLANTAKALNQLGAVLPPVVTGQKRTGMFRIDMVHHILRNKAYIAQRVFKMKGKEAATSKAAWEPIVEFDVFEKAQTLLSKNRYQKRSHLDQRFPYTASGLCFCSECGDRMSGKSAHGRNGKVGYYEHNKKSKHQAALLERQKQCVPFRVQAAILQPELWRRVKDYVLEPDTTRHVLRLAQNQSPDSERQLEAEQTRKRLRTVEGQMEALVERISRLPRDVDDALFMKQLEKLGRERSELAERLLQRERTAPVDSVVPFEDFAKFTAHLRGLLRQADSDPELQSAIIKRLVHRIEIRPHGLEIEFLAGKERLRRECPS